MINLWTSRKQSSLAKWTDCRGLLSADLTAQMAARVDTE